MSSIPKNYLLANEQQTKTPIIVVVIDGVSDVLVNNDLYTRVLYGDPDLTYGEPGIVYGGLRPYSKNGNTFRPYLDLNGSSLTIGQRLEPEQGKASISTLSLAFIDYQGYMTKLISPGVVVPEILGREVKVYLGFQSISYPDDFFQVFRGYISAVEDGPGSVVLQLSDPNIKRRQQICYIAQDTLQVNLGSSSLFGAPLTVLSNANFFQQITGPAGQLFILPFGRFCTCYVKVDDEWIEVQRSAIDNVTLNIIARGARGTTAVAHTAGATVTAAIAIGNNPSDVNNNPTNAIDMALQIMLSGWDGPWITDVPLASIGDYPDPNPSVNSTDHLILPVGYDAVRDFGLVAGDFVILSGSTTPANNGVYVPIVRFGDLDGESNRIIYTDPGSIWYKEGPAVATAGFRSQYDVLPIQAGCSLTPLDVDVQGHLDLKNTFLGSAGNDLLFFITSTIDSAKDFLESQVYFPVGAYSLTRRGLISCGYHSPPIANQNLQILNADNVLDPASIKPSRALNQRAFFNEIDITYNYDDAGNSQSGINITDATSLANIGITSVLPIDAQGIYSGYSVELLQKRAFFLLNRYKNGALMFTIKVNWEVGSQIEAGDIVTISDNGELQIANFSTGARSLDNQLFEVIDRTFDLKGGNVSLKLVGGLGADATDRFATISPSSIVDAGSTASSIVIKDSFGAIFPGNESKKWANYLGLPILVHTADYSYEEETTLESIDPSNNYRLNVSPALSSGAPAAGYIIDVPNYPSGTDPTENELYKLMHAFWTPTVNVSSGVSQSEFTVSSGDIGKFHVGLPVRVHSPDYVLDSGDLLVQSIDLGINGVTLSSTAGFIPSSTGQVDLIGFPDSGQPYRWI